MEADWLSKFGRSIMDSFIVNLCFSPCLRTILEDDIVGRTFTRRGA